MSNYTEGNWSFGHNRGIFSGDTHIADIQPVENGFNETFANAKLIAAAPDLFEALQTLQTAIGYAAENNTLHVLGKQDIDLINAAISKSVGS